MDRLGNVKLRAKKRIIKQWSLTTRHPPFRFARIAHRYLKNGPDVGVVVPIALRVEVVKKLRQALRH